MSLATLTSAAGAAGVTQGRITFPLEGAWQAEVTLDGASAERFAGPVTLDVGGLPLVGQGAPGEDEGGLVTVLVTAGAAGLAASVDAKHYKPPVTRGRVVEDALVVGGETVSPLSSAAVLSATLPQWTRVVGTVRDAMRAVMRSAGAGWRHLVDGTVWVGEETWLPAVGTATLVGEEPTQQLFTIGADSPVVLPGMTYGDQRITWAEYTLDDREMRGRLSYKSTAAPALTVEYATPWLATVVGQNADDETLELKSNDARFPGMSRIPIRAGLPGLVSSTVPVGSVCIVEFENGDPGRPVATGWLSGAATKLALAAELHLGGTGPAPVVTSAAIAEFIDQRVGELAGAILNATPVPQDGGAAIQTAARATLIALGWSGTTPPSSASARVKVAP